MYCLGSWGSAVLFPWRKGGVEDTVFGLFEGARNHSTSDFPDTHSSFLKNTCGAQPYVLFVTLNRGFPCRDDDSLAYAYNGSGELTRRVESFLPTTLLAMALVFM